MSVAFCDALRICRKRIRVATRSFFHAFRWASAQAYGDRRSRPACAAEEAAWTHPYGARLFVLSRNWWSASLESHGWNFVLPFSPALNSPRLTNLATRRFFNSPKLFLFQFLLWRPRRAGPAENLREELQKTPSTSSTKPAKSQSSRNSLSPKPRPRRLQTASSHSFSGVILALGVALELRPIEIDLAQIPGAVSLGFVVEMR